MQDKEVFDVTKLDSNEFAESLGLIQTPVIKFLSREEAEAEQMKEKPEKEDEEEKPAGEKAPKKSRLAKLKEKIRRKRMEKMQKAGSDNNLGF